MNPSGSLSYGEAQRLQRLKDSAHKFISAVLTTVYLMSRIHLEIEGSFIELCFVTPGELCVAGLREKLRKCAKYLLF